jgi:hypothetical protein
VHRSVLNDPQVINHWERVYLAVLWLNTKVLLFGTRFSRGTQVINSAANPICVEKVSNRRMRDTAAGLIMSVPSNVDEVKGLGWDSSAVRPTRVSPLGLRGYGPLIYKHVCRDMQCTILDGHKRRGERLQ